VVELLPSKSEAKFKPQYHKKKKGEWELELTLKGESGVEEEAGGSGPY
jgi:hypothetical protein